MVRDYAVVTLMQAPPRTGGFPTGEWSGTLRPGILVSQGTVRCMEPEGRERSLLTELRRGVVEFCVLALLDRRERYAVEVVRELAQRGLVVSEGTVYPLLSRLRGRGLVETTWRESGLGPPRRYYRLSDSGVAAVARFRREWAALSEAVDGIIATGGDQA